MKTKLLQYKIKIISIVEYSKFLQFDAAMRFIEFQFDEPLFEMLTYLQMLAN